MLSACLSDCCFVRCTPLSPHHAPSRPQERHLMAKSGTRVGPIHMSSCAIVCNRPSCVFMSTLQETCIHVSYVTPNAP